MSEPQVLLLRHGQSVWNAEGRWQGLADPPLSELGKEQAEASVPFLKSHGFVAVFSSDLHRASETAQIIANGLSITDIRRDSRLRERDAGDWTGLTNDEIAERWPELAARRAAGEYVTPVGAKNEYFEATVREIVHELCDAAAAGPILIVSHGGLIRTLERIVTGESSERITNLAGRWYRKEENNLLAAGKFDISALTQTSADNVL